MATRLAGGCPMLIDHELQKHTTVHCMGMPRLDRNNPASRCGHPSCCRLAVFGQWRVWSALLPTVSGSYSVYVCGCVAVCVCVCVCVCGCDCQSGTSHWTGVYTQPETC